RLDRFRRRCRADRRRRSGPPARPETAASPRADLTSHRSPYPGDSCPRPPLPPHPAQLRRLYEEAVQAFVHREAGRGSVTRKLTAEPRLDSLKLLHSRRVPTPPGGSVNGGSFALLRRSSFDSPQAAVR